MAYRLIEFKGSQPNRIEPVHLTEGEFMFCTKGVCEVVIDMKRYILKEGDLVTVFSHSLLQIISYSEDAECIGLAVDMDIISKVQIASKAKYLLRIKENPSINLSSTEMAHILGICEMITIVNQDQEHPFRNEIDENIIKILIYELAAIYDKRKPNEHENSTRDDIIFYNFITMLFNNFKEKRSIEEYAEMLHITPNHLSKVIKRASGRTATGWITDCVILNIKSALLEHDTPINIISDEFNFPNPSFFTQYFKKYAGVTPKAYREQNSPSSS
ncbi:MAG: AraC family transcriptional regulator [Bacteroidales bacterium]